MRHFVIAVRDGQSIDPRNLEQAIASGDAVIVSQEDVPSRADSRPGLGDMVASGLAAVGVTKERVQAVAKAVGVKDCGCAKRQAALNKLGEKLGLPPGHS